MWLISAFFSSSDLMQNIFPSHALVPSWWPCALFRPRSRHPYCGYPGDRLCSDQLRMFDLGFIYYLKHSVALVVAVSVLLRHLWPQMTSCTAPCEPLQMRSMVRSVFLLNISTSHQSVFSPRNPQISPSFFSSYLLDEFILSHLLKPSQIPS